MGRILISGGGIAGLALAWWLERAGLEVLVIDRASAFEPLGHYITLKSQGVAVVREMGLLEACRARELDLAAVQLLTAGGELMRERDFAELDAALGGFVPFHRADLHAALFNAVQGRVPIRYGEQLLAVRQTGKGVEVDFNSGSSERFDLLVGADGVHSNTRQLVFGSDFERPLGGLYLALSVGCHHGLDDGHARIFFGRGQTVILFPTSANTASALIYHGEGGLLPANRDVHSVRTFLLEAYANFAPEVRQAFAALDDNAFVFMDAMTQVRLPGIVRGRVTLVGDAAHCPTFLSGMGSSLALQGARLLGQSLAENPRDMAQALARYEQAVTPIAQGYQNSAQRMRPFFLDRRPQYALLRNTALRHTPEWLLRRGMQRYYQAENLAQA